METDVTSSEIEVHGHCDEHFSSVKKHLSTTSEIVEMSEHRLQRR